mgnify:CR=1 FL=1
MSLSDYVNDDKDDADDHLHFNPNTKFVCLLQYSNWFQSGKTKKNESFPQETNTWSRSIDILSHFNVVVVVVDDKV